MELAGKLSTYSKKQIDFIFAMIETGNISKSCKMANITETTGIKYLKNGLQEDINLIRKQKIEENFKVLEFASIKATETILEVLNDKNCSPTVRLNASKLILDYGLKVREQTQIIERLNNIERNVAENEENGNR